MLSYTIYAPPMGVLGLVLAGLIFLFIARQPAGNELMQSLAASIHEGAMVFLKREYSILAVFIVVVFVLLSLGIGLYTALAFLGGTLCSMFAGYFGMNAATRANVRTSEAAQSHGQNQALTVAFFGGTVMGLSVASLGLLGVGVFFLIFADSSPATISGFAMGASSIALFA
ncbi:MAG: sodium/proton-translocating pyrophosphatase, partial [Nitrospinota bacterium]